MALSSVMKAKKEQAAQVIAGRQSSGKYQSMPSAMARRKIPVRSPKGDDKFLNRKD